MWPIVTDVARSVVRVSVCVSVCVGHTDVLSHCAKTTEPNEMPFETLTHVGPTNHVLDGIKIGRIHSQPRGVTRRRCGV